MAEDLEGKEGSEKNRDKSKTKTSPAEQRARVNDYVAIILAVGTVFLLWLLQSMGLY